MLNRVEATILAVVRASTETLISPNEITRRSGIDLPDAQAAITGLIDRRLLVVTEGGGFITLSGFA